MERFYSLQSRTLTTTATPLPSASRIGFNFRAYGSNQFIRFSSFPKYSYGRNFGFLSLRAQASAPGTNPKVVSEAVEANPKKLDSKDKDLAFVAGATGKVGSRTVRELLKLGFRVRAGVRSAQKADGLLQSVKQMKAENASEATQPVERFEIVECDLERRDWIDPALGNASVVLCCIGASEKEIADITGPYRIDFQATKNLIDAATAVKVDHFILVTSLGTNKFGFPAAILNLFWGVLIWKRKAEEALMASGLPYTIVRPGGMERPTDAYKETHNITLSEEDTLFGGQVSNLQVAELIACMAKNLGLSYCKIVEVIAETTAPLKPMEELLSKIPSKHPFTYSPKESETATEPVLTPSESVIEEPQTTTKEVSTQKEVEPRPLSPFAAYDDYKPPSSPTTPCTSSSASKSTSLSELPTSPVEDEIREEKKKTTPLSPYACYDDLKPPTSPTPTPSTRQSDSDAVNAVWNLSASAADTETSTSKSETGLSNAAPTEERQRPLSPYAAYEDLKPPASPSPTPSVQKQSTSIDSAVVRSVSPLTGGNDSVETVSADALEETSLKSSPDYVYEEPKPPTSTLPNAPSSSGNDTVQSPAADKPRDEQCRAISKLRPLSPYTMYEDMKPPTSPTPSPEKIRYPVGNYPQYD